MHHLNCFRSFQWYQYPSLCNGDVKGQRQRMSELRSGVAETHTQIFWYQITDLCPCSICPPNSLVLDELQQQTQNCPQAWCHYSCPLISEGTSAKILASERACQYLSLCYTSHMVLDQLIDKPFYSCDSHCPSPMGLLFFSSKDHQPMIYRTPQLCPLGEISSSWITLEVWQNHWEITYLKIG